MVLGDDFVDFDKLAKELGKAAEKMKNDNANYEVHEFLEPGHGEGNYKFVFKAKKKGGFGFLKAAVRVAKGAMYGGLSGIIQEASYEVQRQMYRATFEPIDRSMRGSEIAALLRRWSETIPKGYIEAIGSTINLPESSSFISAKISPRKEISITIDFAKLRVIESASKEQVPTTQPTMTPSQPVPPLAPQTIPIPVPVIPPVIPNIKTVLPSIYVAGSLRNVENGFELSFYNNLTDTVLVAPIELKVDGITMATDLTYIRIGNKEVKSSEISLSSPLTFNKNDKMVIFVSGTKLPAGVHRIDVKTNIQGLGEISFTIQDHI